MEKFDRIMNPFGGLFTGYVNMFMKLKIVSYYMTVIMYCFEILIIVGVRRLAQLGEI